MATSAPTFASARKRSSSASACGAGAPSGAEHEHRRALADAERAQPHGELLVGQPPREGLGEHVAGQPPLGVAHRALAHQLERHDVTACWRISRSKSPSPPASRAATSHACGAPRPRSETGSTSERPAISGWSGANSAFSVARGSLRARAAGHLRAHLLHRLVGHLAPERLGGDRLAAAGEHADRAAGGGGERRTTSSSPLSSSTSRSSRLWMAMPAGAPRTARSRAA